MITPWFSKALRQKATVSPLLIRSSTLFFNHADSSPYHWTSTQSERSIQSVCFISANGDVHDGGFFGEHDAKQFT
jgi:hypothetical protein